jgi:hypothetical protein
MKGKCIKNWKQKRCFAAYIVYEWMGIYVPCFRKNMKCNQSVKIDFYVRLRVFHFCSDLHNLNGFFWFLTSYRAAEKVQNDYLSSAWNFRSIEYHHALYFGTLAGLWPWAIGPSLKIEVLGFFIIIMKFLIQRV